MQLSHIFTALTNLRKTIRQTFSDLFIRFFHKRNIIIVSEHHVKHMPITGRSQFAVLAVLVFGVCWASYSTGSYMAANSALKEQTVTLKSMVGEKVENSFVTAMQPSENFTPMNSAKMALSTVDNVDLYSRIAQLEKQLAQTEKSKNEFVSKVRQKTAGSIDTLETVIKQTGLDIDTLKNQTSVPKSKEASNQKITGGQGGPYVPDSTLSPSESEVISNIDELASLKKIVENLPVRKPIFGYQEMSQFGRRIDPFTGRLAVHSGIDLSGPAGSKIYATADGKVSFAGRASAYGNMIDIDHGFKISTRYAHLSQILVEDGQTIKKGQIIGIQGSTGRSTGAHLHYEVRYNDVAMNPKNFLLAGRYVP